MDVSIYRMGEVMIIAAVPPSLVDFYWDKISNFLNKLKEKRKVDIPVNLLYNKALQNKIIPIVISDGKGVITVCMLEFKDNSMYITYMYGADMVKWFDEAIDKAKQIARDMKVQYLRVNLEDEQTRRGWIRVLKRKDFVLNGNNMEYKI